MNAVTLLAIVGEASIPNALMLMIVGMAVVFAALLSIMCLLVLLGRLNGPKSPPPAAAPVPVAEDSSDNRDTVAPEIYAVIAAAVVAAVGPGARIQHVTLVKPEDDIWAVYGRKTIQSSHRIRKG